VGFQLSFLALAGIFGGLQTGVTEKTTNIFLESAYFNPVAIRKTAKKLGLSTDSSFRFERGTDPENTVYAIKRAALLIKEMAGGSIETEIIDNYPKKLNAHEVNVSYKNIDRLIGKQIPRNTIKAILKNLEINILKEEGDQMDLSVPLYRVDVTREADVIEEILRIYGYNNVEIPEHVNSTITYTPHPDFEKYTNLISDVLSNNGFAEIMCNSISKSAYYEGLKTYPKENTVHIVNPLSSDLNCMRQSLLFNSLETILHNVNRQNSNLKLYEFGNCYYLQGDRDGMEKYREERHLSLVLTGDFVEEGWLEKERETTFYDLKKAIEIIFTRVGLKNVKYTEINNDIFVYGLECKRGNIVFGQFGLVQPKLAKLCDVKKDVFYAEINWDNVVGAVKNSSLTFTELPKFPEVRRDLALLLDKKTPFEKVKDIALKTEKKLLKEINLFDVFEDEKIGRDKKSYAVSFILQDVNATLKDNQIDAIMDKMMKAFEKELKAVIR